MKSVFAAAAAVLLATAACAPVIQGGPPIDLPPGLQETAQIGSITMSSGWLNAEEDFYETFSEEVREELGRCMYGTAPIDVRIHVDRLERASRLDTLFRGQGMHSLEGTVEFVDPSRGNLVVGRFPIAVATTAGGRIAGLLGDRQMMVSEEFGRSVCEQAFGRNPRDRGPHNATSG
ncbi:hypothetical protein N0B44_16845 [Roseibacterium beibuensis]|uniref:hypothetical protein n=1 Tax=[Roseibacterium] beibuensis TaxID=1193142 RepID=UPI00217E8BA9|nr:hypothetical protein [Roseibacterium beibuensis]MCS6624586.1 hypothetical protein [Roseibacterium beibuensis]